MKHLVILFLFAAPSFGQLIVSDPLNTAVNSSIQAAQVANNAEVLLRWAENLERLNQQLKQLEGQLAEQRRIRTVLGEPASAGERLSLNQLGAADLGRAPNNPLQEIRRLANAVASLQRTADGIFTALDDRTSLGTTFARQESYYQRYAAVEQQADQFEAMQATGNARSDALQAELATTLEQLRGATTQADVDKLNVKVAALNGQLTEAAARRRDEADKLHAQQILNDNQAAKERQDLLEKQIAEEQQTLAAVGSWQGALKLTPTSYTQP